jgi:poly(3-hydroxyalkanoate) depolymerase
MTEAQQRTIAYTFHDVDGERLYVADTGRTDEAATPLLIFNGIGASTRLLEPLLRALHHHRVILFDLPGVGASRVASRIRRLGALATLTTQLLDRLGVDRVNILGVSWGGGLAQEYARRYPERCERLVLAATSTGHLMVPPNPLVMWRMATPLRYLSAGYAKAIAGAIYGGDLRRDSARTEEHVRRMEPPSWWGYASQLYALAGWTSLPWLHQLRLPTLVMAGRDDPLVPLVNARLLARLIPNAELEIYDCGHLFLLTRTVDAVTRIERFLATT